MTDYLEERLENAGVLLEQVKRLEGSGFAPESGQREEDRAGPPLERGESPPSGGGGEADFGAEEAVDGLKRKVNRLKKQVNNAAAPPLPQSEAAKKAVNPLAKPETRPRERDGEPVEVREEAADRRKQTRFNRERAEKNALALQLEKLDRAAGIVQGALELPERSGAPAPGLNHLPWGTADDSGLSGGSGWNGAPESGWSSPTALPGGELDVAQLADRAFRRDSRRYDGGFFLY